MPKMTIHDQIVAGLTERGETLVKRTGRYTVMTRSKRVGTYYFIGKAGALRVGRNASSSLAVLPDFKEAVIRSGQTNEARITDLLKQAGYENRRTAYSANTGRHRIVRMSDGKTVGHMTAAEAAAFLTLPSSHYPKGDRS